MTERDKFDGASKRVLDINSLADVLEACENCAVNWNPMGLKLGLSHPQLEQIAAVTNVPKERLQRVLVAWLQKDTLPGSPDPSYYTLCHAVATGGKDTALADRIAAVHPATAAAAADDQQMDTDTDSISNASAGYYTDEDLNRLCSCGECSLQKIITEGCPVTGVKSSHRFPLLDIKRLPDGKRQQYIYMIEKEANTIITAFTDVCDDISQSMKDISVGRLKNYCKNMRWFHEAVNEHSLHDRLERCKNIEDVFSVLADICSWFNHHPLKALVNKFGSEDVKKKYAKFVSHTLMTFLKRSITEIPKDGLGDVIEGSKQFRLKIGTTAAHENIKGERMYFLKGSVAEALEISIEHLHIVSIKGGCIEVTFMIPLVIYKELFLPDLSSQYSQALQSITVSIDDHHSLIVRSVHWYDSECHCPREKVFSNDAVTSPHDHQAILSDIHTSQEIMSQEIENLQRDSLHVDLPSSSVKTPVVDTYGEMQDDFAIVLREVVDEAVKSNHDVEGVKEYLLAFGAGIKNEMELVKEKGDLIELLRKYCSLSNFDLLNRIAKQFKLEYSTKKLKEVAKKCQDYYRTTLAVDFARQSIEDHVTVYGQQEMTIIASWRENTTLHDFDEFVKYAFDQQCIFISLKAVHTSPLSFLCTIPSWLVHEMKQFVRERKSNLKSRGIIEVSVDNTVISVGSNADTVPINLHENVESESAARKALASLLKRFLQPQQEELRILVTGKTGQGKSTLVNGILGAQVAREGAGAKRVTTEVEVFSRTIIDVPVKVFDSPGLQDRTPNEEAYIRGMRDTCKELSLVLYCTKMTETRLTDDDRNAMIKLTRAFGEKFWNYAVFVLTFANKEDVTRRDERDDPNDPEPEDDDDKGWKQFAKKRFQGRLKLWEEELQRFLIKEVKVSPEIAQRIPVVPTGDYKKSRNNSQPFVLPDRDDWFSDFWKVCCLQVKDTSLFLQVNHYSNRLVMSEDSDYESGDEEPSVRQAIHAAQESENIQKDIEVLDKFIATSDYRRKLEDEEIVLTSGIPQVKSEEFSQPKVSRKFSTISMYSQGSYGKQSQIPVRRTQSFSVTHLPPPSDGHLYKRRIVIDEEFSQCVVTEAIERNVENSPEVVKKVKTAWKRITNKTVLFVKTVFRRK